MTTTILPSPVPSLLDKKRVLLIDTSSSKREMRSEVMRKLGMEVDCAADITEARSWWKADLYDLVLIDIARGLDYSEAFCDDVRSATPSQPLAFLVGAPEYLAATPNIQQALPSAKTQDEVLVGEARAALSAGRGDLPLRWGILEASRRISAVRFASVARTKAMREKPSPARDVEGRVSRRTTAATLDDLLREEMQ